MSHGLLLDPRWVAGMLALDVALADEVRSAGCPCGGRLHRASYPRKPRGLLPGFDVEALSRRTSFCCHRDGCRERAGHRGCLSRPSRPCCPNHIRSAGRCRIHGRRDRVHDRLAPTEGHQRRRPAAVAPRAERNVDVMNAQVPTGGCVCGCSWLANGAYEGDVKRCLWLNKSHKTS